MLADVLTCIWVVMASFLGWRRRAKYEMASLVCLVVAFLGARFGGVALGASVGKIAKIGPFSGQFLTTAILWLVLYIVLLLVWRRLSSGEQANIRVEVDEMGNPVVKGGQIGKFGGALLGAVRGLVLFLGVVSLLVVLVPSFLYKNGRGTAMVQPKSITMKTLKRYDPSLRAMEDVARGLRSLRYLRRNRTKRRKLMRKYPAVKAAYNAPKVKKLRRNVKLMRKANHRRQGKRDSTLLLWMPAFQEAILDPDIVKALSTLAKRAPSPFDRYRDKGAPKKSGA